MSNKNNQIAIIVPIYNAGNKLKKCIRSILNQTFKNFTLILVDDGSTDNSGKICDSYAEKDERIVVIHQENKGSVEARKAGVLSDAAQNSKYLMLSDADDTMPKNAVEALYANTIKYEADCVCGCIKRMIGNITFENRYTSPCFKIEKPETYTHDSIMDKLYVSCFGITDYPVNLVAKLYSKELLTDAVNMMPIVHFMGDDLSVTLRIMPNTQKLVIIPDIIYHYRIGGGTSKFMPYMLDDFLSLYREKNKLRQKYEMNSNIKMYMDIELMNIVKSYLIMCKSNGKFSKEKLKAETLKTISVPEIESAAEYLISIGKNHQMAEMIHNKDVAPIISDVENDYKRSWWKMVIKKIFAI